MKRLLVSYCAVLLGATFVSRADCLSAPNIFQTFNCGFASSASQWSVVLGTGVWSSTDGAPTAGSLEIASAENLAHLQVVEVRSPCVDGTTVSGVTTTQAFQHKLASGAAPSSCSCGFSYYSNSTCTSGGAGGFNLTFTPASSWTKFTRTNYTTNSGAYVRYDCTCQAPTGSAFTVRFDDFWAGPGTTPVDLQRFSAN